MTTKFIDTPARVAVATTSIDIDAPKAKVFDAFLNNPNGWFYENEESRKNTPTRCEPRLGGKFYIEYPSNGFNVLGEITMIKHEHKIRMRGDCTMPQAVLMNMTISFEEIGSGTRVTIDHRMMGELEDSWAQEFEHGWSDGLEKLKSLMEG